MSDLSHAMPRRSRADLFVPIVFTATIFLSASLLFFVQPLFAKIVLPEIGGAASVWTTAMLFFQTMLICGYLYAHLSTRFLPVRAQVALHLCVWALGLFFLPLAIPDDWTWTVGQPAAWQTLALFAAGVGVPFAALSANAPLIQSWYARSNGPSAHDPYFLYGASNLGSLIALLGFPLVAEPLWGTNGIGAGFAIGYAVLGVGLLAAGALARGGASAARRGRSVNRPGQVAHWLVLAFVPSSLMLSVTTKISTDIGSIPLVWAVPLSLYLLSFVVTFRKRAILPPLLSRLLTVVALALLASVFLGLTGGHQSLTVICLMAVSFFMVAVFAHRRLYETRPDGAGLTGFYLAMSVGGALGGLFNSILAPQLFDTLAEGPVSLAVAVALLLSPAALRMTRATALRSVVLGAGAGGLLLLLSRLAPQPELVAKALLLGAALVLVAALRRNIGAALLALVVFVAPAMSSLPDDAVFRDRSFFGVHKINDEGNARLYTNGTTLHGAQLLDEGGARPTPLSYYHAGLPLAELIRSPVGQAARDVGIVGLGVGAMACHAQPGQAWTFYEIDPVVADIAQDPALFSYLSECTPDAPVLLGDARMVLERDPQTFDILVIDAYSSDAVPVHLTTTEAMRLYMDRLNPGGVLIYHISNRYYDLTVPLGRSAAALGLVGAHRYDRPEATELTAHASSVVALSRDAQTLERATEASNWEPLSDDGGREWRDDYANLLGLLLR